MDLCLVGDLKKIRNQRNIAKQSIKVNQVAMKMINLNL